MLHCRYGSLANTTQQILISSLLPLHLLVDLEWHLRFLTSMDVQDMLDALEFGIHPSVQLLCGFATFPHLKFHPSPNMMAAYFYQSHLRQLSANLPTCPPYNDRISDAERLPPWSCLCRYPQERKEEREPESPQPSCSNPLDSDLPN